MSYLPVFLLFLAGLVIGGVVLLLTSLLGKGRPHPLKSQHFECGVPPYTQGAQRFPIQFYVVALLFLLFDVEVLFLFPWALVYRSFLKVNDFILWEMLFFLLLLGVGYLYLWKKRALEWE